MIILLTSSQDKMPVGKFKGLPISYIIHNHTQYAEWMIANMKNIQFSQLIKNDLRTWKFLSK